MDLCTFFHSTVNKRKENLTPLAVLYDCLSLHLIQITEFTYAFKALSSNRVSRVRL